jgi:hypothetical protein
MYRSRVSGRTRPPVGQGERETLQAFLDFQRATLRWKASGVTEEDARRPLLPSSALLTLAGLVRHLTAVERAWFRLILAAEPVADLGTADDPKAMRVPDGVRIADLVAAYEAECRACDAAVAGFALDDVARRPGHPETLRWVLCHLIEETARHNGHADLLREHADGRTGE